MNRFLRIFAALTRPLEGHPVLTGVALTAWLALMGYVWVVIIRWIAR